MIDYDEASRSYDDSRSASDEIIALFAARVGLGAAMSVLDFGCGTGNYLARIHALYGSRCFGIEPSDGMRSIATRRNPGATILKGDHEHVPFDPGVFDFAYMTDVIHHVADMGPMFLNIARCLKTRGKVCVVTESWDQIDGRWYNRYFPSLASNEKRRYPDVSRIVRVAQGSGLVLLDVQATSHAGTVTVDGAFVRLVEQKDYSMFRLLDPCEYQVGLRALRADVGKAYTVEDRGETLIWMEKPRV